MKKFSPKPRERRKRRHITIDLSPEEYEQVTKAAEAYGISIKSFTRQALVFAIENMDEDGRHG